MSQQIYIKHLSHYHPETVVTNQQFENFLDTTSDWILERTGIRERRAFPEYSGDFPGTELAKRALQGVLDDPGFDRSRVGMIISAATHDDIHYPNAGNLIAEELGLEVPVFQIKVACTSVAYAIFLARSILATSMDQDILIVNGEAFTRYLDYGDRRSSILFGDAATALVVSKNPGVFEVLDVEIGGKGLSIVQATRVSETSHLTVDDLMAGELTHGKPELNRRRSDQKKFQQDGKKVVEFVLSEIPPKVKALLSRKGLNLNDLSYVVTHQSNLVMMTQLYDALEIPSEKRLYNVDRFGNTGSSGWVTVLSETHPKIRENALVLASVFGAGMTWANLLLRKTQ
ncbi:MAG: beta-ketoacyl-acyl carrier protein synthase [Pseudomonadota bacterium]